MLGPHLALTFTAMRNKFQALPCTTQPNPRHRGNRSVANSTAVVLYPNFRSRASFAKPTGHLSPCIMHANVMQPQQQLVNRRTFSVHTACHQWQRPAAPLPPGSSEALWPCCTPPASGNVAARRGVTIIAAATASPAAPAEAVPAVKRARRTAAFPFVRLAGQEEMKLALLLNVIDPSIGGVLIMGDRGTGKSVAVRAMVEMLPSIEVVPDDAFNSSPTDPKFMGPDALQRFRNGEQLPSARAPTPLVELPLGATEDRICGTIDIEKALGEGIKAYEPGLLAKANRGILYVDEVNLLDDGLVDVVLDSAASGVNTVEREGISIAHPARFIMIGSGNPSERALRFSAEVSTAQGELRPQLLDRFGLSVNVATIPDTDTRARMVMDRLEYEADPDGFAASVELEQQALRDELIAATAALKQIECTREIKLKISEICSLLDVDGIRGDMVINRAARALVAFEGRTEVGLDDVAKVIALCLNHRMRKDPLDPIDNGTKVQLAFRRVTSPKAVAEEEKRKKEEQAAAKKAAAPAKAGAWSGLPGR